MEGIGLSRVDWDLMPNRGVDKSARLGISHSVENTLRPTFVADGAPPDDWVIRVPRDTQRWNHCPPLMSADGMSEKEYRLLRAHAGVRFGRLVGVGLSADYGSGRAARQKVRVAVRCDCGVFERRTPKALAARHDGSECYVCSRRKWFAARYGVKVPIVEDRFLDDAGPDAWVPKEPSSDHGRVSPAYTIL